MLHKPYETNHSPTLSRIKGINKDTEYLITEHWASAKTPAAWDKLNAILVALALSQDDPWGDAAYELRFLRGLAFERHLMAIEADMNHSPTLSRINGINKNTEHLITQRWASAETFTAWEKLVIVLGALAFCRDDPFDDAGDELRFLAALACKRCVMVVEADRQGVRA